MSRSAESPIVYASFDRFPSPKGAATHIDAFVRALASQFGTVDLVTIPPPPDGVHGEEGVECSSPTVHCDGVQHHPLPALGPNLIDRALHFRSRLAAWWGRRRPEVVHVRSIFEGYPIARNKGRLCENFVFEVNGLPSIELKYHYPEVSHDRELLAKLRAQEDACLEAADLIITVSDVGAEHLLRRGADPRRIRVIPNGVSPDLFPYQRPRLQASDEAHMLYAGTLSSWQGVMVALEALALYRRDFPARLTLVGSARRRQIRQIKARAWELGVCDFVDILEPVSREDVARLHHAADVVLAPLLPNDRNLVQGCCPLKVLEAMASGTPLIASDIPVVRALARAEIDAILVRPGSAKAIKDAMLRLRASPHLGPRISASARRRVKTESTWKIAQAKLLRAYEELLEVTSFRQTASAAAPGLSRQLT